MIEIGCDFNVKDINKIKKYKNPTMNIYKNKLNKNSNYKIFLNKTQFNNLLKNNSIRYRLTDSKKIKHYNWRSNWIININGFKYY